MAVDPFAPVTQLGGMKPGHLGYITAYVGYGKSAFSDIHRLGASHVRDQTCGIHRLGHGRIEARICGVHCEAMWTDTFPTADDLSLKDFQDILAHVLSHHYDSE